MFPGALLLLLFTACSISPASFFSVFFLVLFATTFLLLFYNCPPPPPSLLVNYQKYCTVRQLVLNSVIIWLNSAVRFMNVLFFFNFFRFSAVINVTSKSLKQCNYVFTPQPCCQYRGGGPGHGNLFHKQCRCRQVGVTRLRDKCSHYSLPRTLYSSDNTVRWVPRVRRTNTGLMPSGGFLYTARLM